MTGTSGRVLLAILLGTIALFPRPSSGQIGPILPSIDPEIDCVEVVPDSLSVNGVTDPGAMITLRVRILLDGVSQSRAQQIVTQARTSYDSLGINLTPTYQSVSFSGNDALAIIQQARSMFGGTRPSGVDLVHVLTSKDIEIDGDDTVAGLADCIGGVRFGNRAFSVSEVEPLYPTGSENLPLGPLTLYANVSAKLAAHEMGHLLGGHHHYANCIEGAPSAAALEPGPCTLMFNVADFVSPNFSTLNGAIVRGHSVLYAAP